MLILSPKKESKIGSKEPENRQNLKLCKRSIENGDKALEFGVQLRFFKNGARAPWDNIDFQIGGHTRCCSPKNFADEAFKPVPVVGFSKALRHSDSQLWPGDRAFAPVNNNSNTNKTLASANYRLKLCFS